MGGGGGGVEGRAHRISKKVYDGKQPKQVRVMGVQRVLGGALQSTYCTGRENHENRQVIIKVGGVVACGCMRGGFTSIYLEALTRPSRKMSRCNSSAKHIVVAPPPPFTRIAHAKLHRNLRGGLLRGTKTARIAESKTVFRPAWVSAEHSRYCVAPIVFDNAKP